MRIKWVVMSASADDDGAAGSRLHAVELGKDTLSYKVTVAEVGRRPALCGSKPQTGWEAGSSIKTPCRPCVGRAIKLGIAVSPEIAREYTKDTISRTRGIFENDL